MSSHHDNMTDRHPAATPLGSGYYVSRGADGVDRDASWTLIEPFFLMVYPGQPVGCCVSGSVQPGWSSPIRRYSSLVWH